MNFYDLINVTEEYHPLIHTLTDYDVQIYGAVRTKQMTAPEENILYIVDSACLEDSFDMSSFSGLLNVLVLGNIEELPDCMSLKKINLLFITEPCDYYTILESVTRKITSDERLHDSMRILTDALFSNRGIQHILDTAHSIIRNPLFETGRANARKFYSVDDTDINSDAIIRKFIECIEQGGDLADKVLNKYLFTHEASEYIKSEKNNDVLRFFNKSIGKEQMIIKIKAKGVSVGLLCAIAVNREFTDFDVSFFARTSLLISQELQKKSLYTKNRNETKAQFLNYLLTSHDVSERYIYEMTRIRKIVDVKSRFYVAVVEGSDAESEISSDSFDIIIDHLKPILINSFYLIRETELVILFNLNEKTDISELADSYFETWVIPNKMIVGISNSFRDLKETKRYYRQAKKASAIGARLNDWDINYFSKIAPMEALQIINAHDDLLSFCMPEVLDLFERDKDSNSDLITTLYVFLENFGNTTRSAQQLFIHKNTLLYRITKIKEILHSDLDNGEDIFKIMLSLRILRILSLYHPPVDIDILFVSEKKKH